MRVCIDYPTQCILDMGLLMSSRTGYDVVDSSDRTGIMVLFSKLDRHFYSRGSLTVGYFGLLHCHQASACSNAMLQCLH